MAIGKTRDQKVGTSKMTNLSNSKGRMLELTRVPEKCSILANRRKMVSAKKENRNGRIISLNIILDNRDIRLRYDLH